MSYTIAIQPDDYGPDDSSSRIWSALLKERGHNVRLVDVRQADIIGQLDGCDGFMWRCSHHPDMLQIARRLLPVVEKQLGLCVYPDWNTFWHYDDKIAQNYLLKAAGAPVPETWVWFDEVAAKDWAKLADYPLVIKLYAGAGSSNVSLVPNVEVAHYWIDKLFSSGVPAIESSWHLAPSFDRFSKGARLALKGVPPDPPWPLHKNYALFQEFVPENDFDTRVTIIGDRAFSYRRMNRPDDFRASGSGDFDTDPDRIDKNMIRIGFDLAKALETHSIAIDFLKKKESPVVAEISYTYVSWMVRDCPGYWDFNLSWHDGHSWPEESQIADFLQRLDTAPVDK